MINLETGAWREIAERASAEVNPAKMLVLVNELCQELDREDYRECERQTFGTNSAFTCN